MPQGVPSNIVGFQEAASGDGYLGLLAYGSFAPDLKVDRREFATGTLSAPLKKDSRYYVSFKASFMNRSSHAVNRLGVKFHTSARIDLQVSNSAHVFSSKVIKDTLRWQTVSGWFVADSAYTHFSIGNHFSDDSTKVEVFQAVNMGYNAYYLLDDFCVSTDSKGCWNPVGLIRPIEPEFSLFPNPTLGEFEVITKTKGIVMLSIYDLIGHEIKSVSFTGRCHLDLTNFPKGAYAYTLVDSEGEENRKNNEGIISSISA